MASSYEARHRQVSISFSEVAMSRVQLALNVNDIDEAVSFYTKLFGTGPAKRRPGYANFAISEPPLKLVLLENPGQGGTLNHLGVEVDSATFWGPGDKQRSDAVQAELDGDPAGQSTQCCGGSQAASGGC